MKKNLMTTFGKKRSFSQRQGTTSFFYASDYVTAIVWIMLWNSPLLLLTRHCNFGQSIYKFEKMACWKDFILNNEVLETSANFEALDKSYYKHAIENIGITKQSVQFWKRLCWEMTMNFSQKTVSFIFALIYQTPLHGFFIKIYFDIYFMCNFTLHIFRIMYTELEIKNIWGPTKNRNHQQTDLKTI